MKIKNYDSNTKQYKAIQSIIMMYVLFFCSCEQKLQKEIVINKLSPQELEYLPKGGIKGIKAEIYSFIKGYQSYNNISFKSTVDSITNKPLNESIWIFEAATNTIQSQGFTDDIDFKKKNYEITLNNTIVNNEVFFTSSELFQKFSNLEELINTDKLDGSFLKFSDVFLKEITLNTAVFKVIAHYVKGNKISMGNSAASIPPACLWNAPPNISFVERVRPPRNVPDGGLYNLQDNWKWGNLLGKCDGTNVGEDASTVLEADLNYYWSHIVTGVPLINVQTLDGNSLDFRFLSGYCCGTVGEFKANNVSTGSSNVTQQLFSQGGFSTSLGQYWFANVIPDVSLAFVNTNDLVEDNVRDFLIYDSYYTAGISNSDCLNKDDLHFYYCSMREAIETIRPKCWNYDGPLEFLSLEILTDEENIGLVDNKWHYLQNITYGIPLSQDYQDKGYFTAY